MEVNKATRNKLSELVKEMGYDGIAADIKRGYKVKESLKLALEQFRTQHGTNPQIEAFCGTYLKLL